ncbi:MAG: pentapeptide repeat-containing protein [Bacteroidales bacterium]|nr:pentapeptide repeat-containing protein [Bacteroidales bacterium]
MSDIYLVNRIFENEDFCISKPFKAMELENCIFKNCNFEAVDLSKKEFVDCRFEECNLSLIQIHQTTFRNTQFTSCKMLGIRFEDANSFGLEFNFEKCTLNDSSFYQCKISSTQFVKCSLIAVDFSESQLDKCKFDFCDFSGSIFESTNLTKANLRNSFNFSISPQNNVVDGLIISRIAVEGVLDSFKIIVED